MTRNLYKLKSTLNTRQAVYVIFAVQLFCVPTAHAGIILTLKNPANGHIYHLLTANTWTASQAEAVSLGGNLVTINDQSENDWVYNSFNGGGVRSLWIGLNDVAVEGQFEWISGEPVTYTNWAGPELSVFSPPLARDRCLSPVSYRTNTINGNIAFHESANNSTAFSDLTSGQLYCSCTSTPSCTFDRFLTSTA